MVYFDNCVVLVAASVVVAAFVVVVAAFEVVVAAFVVVVAAFVVVVVDFRTYWYFVDSPRLFAESYKAGTCSVQDTVDYLADSFYPRSLVCLAVAVVVVVVVDDYQ